MKRARIIYNPTSGREAIRRDLVDILNVYEQAGYETSAFATTPEPNSRLFRLGQPMTMHVLCAFHVRIR